MTAALATAALVAAGLAATPSAATAAPTPKPPKTVSFSDTGFEVTEGQASGCVGVSRSVTKGKAPVVTVTTTGGTASAGVDYTAGTSTVTFARGGSGSGCVPILVDHVLGEGDETVTLSLATTSRGWTVGTTTTTTLTIHEMGVPGAPTGLTADVVTDTADPYVALDWTAPSNPVDHYVVLSSSVAAIGPYTILGTTTATDYVTPAPTTDRWYVVEAVSAEGAYSDDSNVAFADGFLPGSGLYWTDESHGIIRSGNTDGTGANVFLTGLESPFGVAVDASHLYWASVGGDAIMRSDLDGSNVTTLISDAAGSHPYGVAVDASHVYWTDLQSQQVKRADLDGSNVTTLIDGSGILQPAAIAVDGTHLYLGDVAGNGSIMRANLDGSGRTTVVANQTYPFAIAVDSGHIYWANTGANEGATGQIRQSNLDGTGAVTLLSGEAHPAGLAVDASYLYWANANDGTIVRADLDGTNRTVLVSETVATGGVAVQK